MKDYLIRSKLLGSGGAGIMGREDKYGFLLSGHYDSILFTFVPPDLYYDKTKMARWVFIFLLVGNILFFFVKQKCWQRCIDNLTATLSLEKNKATGIQTLEDRRKTMAILVVQWVHGVILCPGAHTQF